MKKLYHIYNDKNEITYAAYFDVQPENGTLSVNTGFIKPMYDKMSDCVYEGASESERLEVANKEIEELDLETTIEIYRFMKVPEQKKVLRGIEIPEEINKKYDQMREEFHIKKQAILDKYGIITNL